MHAEDEKLLIQARTAKNEGAAGLDATRQAQPGAGAQGRAKPNYYAWLPLGGVVLASLFVAVLWLVQPAVSPMPELDSAADFELLSGHEDLDFYQELEFYYWLDEEDRHAD